MNSDCHYMVMISVAKCSDCHYVLPQMSLPRSDSHKLFIFSVIYYSVQFQTLRFHTKHQEARLNKIISIPYSRKIWQRIKFGGLVV